MFGGNVLSAEEKIEEMKKKLQPSATRGRKGIIKRVKKRLR